MKLLASLALICLCSCADLPRDADGTLDRIHRLKSFRVGLIAEQQADAGRSIKFVQALERSTAARALTGRGATEPLLKQLKQGKLDVVIGRMTAKSPWMKQVHMVPLTKAEEADPEEIQLVAITRNGENAWISMVHREASTAALNE